MKTYLKCSPAFFALIFGLSLAKTAMAQVQTNSPAPQAGAAATTISPADKARLMKAREQALAANPDLKAEQENLMKQREAMKSGSATPDERKAFMQSMMDHQKKMRTAILQVDPTLGPVLDQMEQQMKQRMQQRASGGA